MNGGLQVINISTLHFLELETGVVSHEGATGDRHTKVDSLVTNGLAVDGDVDTVVDIGKYSVGDGEGFGTAVFVEGDQLALRAVSGLLGRNLDSGGSRFEESEFVESKD